MKALLMTLFALCSCASSQLDWGNDDVMLPEGFPFILKSEYREEGPLRFWVLTYDLNGDDERDLRVWYLYRSEQFDSLTNVIIRTVYPHPYRVELFDGRVLAWKAKVDDRLEGKTRLLLISQNGQWLYRPRAQGYQSVPTTKR